MFISTFVYYSFNVGSKSRLAAQLLKEYCGSSAQLLLVGVQSTSCLTLQVRTTRKVSDILMIQDSLKVLPYADYAHLMGLLECTVNI